MQRSNKLAAIWLWLSGKKTAIAATFWFVTQTILPIYFTDGVPDLLSKTILAIGSTLTFLGLGHKVVKSRHQHSASREEV